MLGDGSAVVHQPQPGQDRQQPTEHASLQVPDIVKVNLNKKHAWGLQQHQCPLAHILLLVLFPHVKDQGLSLVPFQSLGSQPW